jgi:ABC-type Mn2+/Zn2+ transport system permease subunit
MIDFSNISPITLSLTAAAATGVAAGFLGVFLVLRNMALVSVALSHVALPGIALGLLLGINPFFGAFVFLFAASFLILGIEKRTHLPTDAIVGVIFTTSLAAGILLTPEPELLEALFGNFTDVSLIETLAIVFLSFSIVLVTLFSSRALLFNIVAPDLGHVSRSRQQLAYLIFLIMLALVVALGIKFVGTLLMGTLTVIPAASAKNISRTLLQFMTMSVVFAFISVVVGVGASFIWDVMAGPAIILSGVGIFLITLLFVRR